MIGSLATRFAIGVGIDRYGPRRIWIGSGALFVVACLAHLAVTSPTGAAIYFWRIAYCSAMAGICGALLTFIAVRVPRWRTAEMVGMVGAGGFLGNILGTHLGDLLRGGGLLARSQTDGMFIAAAVLGILGLPISWLAMRGYRHPRSGPGPSALGVLRRHNPGLLLLGMVVMMGAVLNLPNTFLPTFAARLHILRIAPFFTVYALAAVATRLSTRRWPQQLGLRRMLLLGSGVLVAGQLMFLWATSAWWLALPGLAYGMAHAVLFPAGVAAVDRWFPAEHRGLATTLSLAMWDIGQLIGMPAAGAIVHYGGWTGWPPYHLLFLSMAGVAAVVALAYGWQSRDAGQAAQPVGQALRA
jgi:MFS family permease